LVQQQVIGNRISSVSGHGIQAMKYDLLNAFVVKQWRSVIGRSFRRHSVNFSVAVSCSNIPNCGAWDSRIESYCCQFVCRENNGDTA